MDTGRIKSILESLIFVSDEPIPLAQLVKLVEGAGKKDLQGILEELKQDIAARGGGIELIEVAGGYQFRTVKDNAKWVSKLFEERPQRLTRASLETMAIVAYRQPIVRQEVERIRGVESGGVLKTLLERNLIRIVGRQDVPGRPVLYGTTSEFLEFFGLNALTDLPPLRDIAELGDATEELIAEYAEREGTKEAGIPFDSVPPESLITDEVDQAEEAPDGSAHVHDKEHDYPADAADPAFEDEDGGKYHEDNYDLDQIPDPLSQDEYDRDEEDYDEDEEDLDPEDK